MPERFEEYLNTVAEQIRWKRAREPLLRELRCHLEEQRDECIKSGMDEEAAEREAVRQMGDAECVGQELDSVHRPTPQWGLLAMTCLVTACGCVFRGFDGRTVFYTLLGLVLMLGLYFLDYAFLAKHGRIIYGLTLLGSAAATYVSPMLSGRIYYLQYAVLLYPVVYVFWVYSFKGRGPGGLLTALLGAVPLLLLCFLVPTVLGTAIVAVSVAVTIVTASVKGWFAVGRKVRTWVLSAALGIPALCVGVTAVRHWDGIVRRLSVAIDPSIDPRSEGYLGMLLREMLSHAQLLGRSTSETWYRMPEVNDYILAHLIEAWGYLPFALLVLALVGLVLLSARKCFKERGTLQRLIGTSVLLTLGLQLASSIAANLGFVLIVGTCPFIGGSAHTVIDMALMGLLLSVLRSSKLPQSETVYPPRPLRRPPRITYEDGSIVIAIKRM